WPHEGDAGIQNNHIDPAVRRIAGDAAVVVDTNTIVPSTWHPLGGANMGSVCDLDGRVLGQRGLYVLDGALMPGNAAACNPSMTIAAVAERVARDVGTIIRATEPGDGNGGVASHTVCVTPRRHT